MHGLTVQVAVLMLDATWCVVVCICRTVNLVDVVGATPLVYAAKENQFAAVQLLLANGADPNVAQENGTTALHEAAANGSIETCKLLLAHSADLEATAQFGTALHFAVSENQEETVEFLIQHGANVNKANPKGVTPLMLTGVLNKPALAKQLLVAQADLTHSIMGGLTALHISAEAGSIDLVKEFLEHRAEDSAIIANTKTEVGATPLQHAAGKGHHEIVTLLKPLTKGFEDADVDALMADEKIRLEQFYENAAQYMPEPEQQPEKPQTPEDAIRGELVPEEDIVVPEAVELDEATLAKAMALKEEGNKAYVAKEFATAVQKYTEAIALSPADAVLFSNRCAAYLGAGDAVKALHDVRISKKLKPEWAKALFREGQCLEALNLFEEAAFAMWSAIQLAPKDALLEKRFQECVARGRAYHQSQVAAADASKA